ERRALIGGPIDQRAVVGWQRFAFHMLHLRLRSDTNTPLPSERSFARHVGATVAALNGDGNEMFEMHARWSDEPQPPNLGPAAAVPDILTVDFALGQSREIDLCFIAGDGNVYGFNNDSYHHDNLIDPRWRMDGNNHCLRVRVQGLLIDAMYMLTFESGDG